MKIYSIIKHNIQEDTNEVVGSHTDVEICVRHKRMLEKVNAENKNVEFYIEWTGYNEGTEVEA